MPAMKSTAADRLTKVIGQSFGYQAILTSDMSGTVSSLIAYQVTQDDPMRAVVRGLPRTSWVYAPNRAV